MEEIQLKAPAKIKVIFDGKEYLVAKPTLGEARALNREIKEAKSEEENLDVLYGFLVSKGMSEAVLDAMDLDSLSLLVDTLAPKKKA